MPMSDPTAFLALRLMRLLLRSSVHCFSGPVNLFSGLLFLRPYSMPDPSPLFSSLGVCFTPLSPSPGRRFSRGQFVFFLFSIFFSNFDRQLMTDHPSPPPIVSLSACACSLPRSFLPVSRGSVHVHPRTPVRPQTSNRRDERRLQRGHRREPLPRLAHGSVHPAADPAGPRGAFRRPRADGLSGGNSGDPWDACYTVEVHCIFF